MADFGIKITTSGTDATETDIDSFPEIFSLFTGYNALKLFHTGTITLTTPASGHYILEQAVNHDLGYVPIVLAVAQDPDSSSTFNGGTPFWLRLPTNMASNPVVVEYGITSTAVTFRAENSNTSPSAFNKTIPIKYWIFWDKLADN